jgi:predicted MFS family arabinose efflux permease
MAEDESEHQKTAPRGIVRLMALGTGLTVASMYYCQPLLGEMARTLHCSERAVNFVPVATQIGVSLGMLLFVPLGDVRERRSLTVSMCVALAAMCVASALAPNLTLLLVAGFALGVTSNVPHLILPFAAHMAGDHERGRVVGTVISGLLIGVLLGRVAAGFIGGWLGWRSIYWITAVALLALALLLRAKLPVSVPTVNLRYADLLLSVVKLVRTQATLREACFTGAMLFGSFCVFWTTLVFVLSHAPYAYAPRSAAAWAGGFGIVAAASASIAPFVGHWLDRGSVRRGVALASVLALLSFGVLRLAGFHLWGLTLGVILLDLAVQSGHIANQTRIYQAFPEARSRANTAYMCTYFLGGGIGSWLGGMGWAHFGWTGVCAAGALMTGAGTAAMAIGGRTQAGFARKSAALAG